MTKGKVVGEEEFLAGVNNLLIYHGSCIISSLVLQFDHYYIEIDCNWS